MSNKFEDVPKEKETKIISSKEMKLGKYDALFELWFWDGIAANSCIFDNNDIKELDDNDLKELVKPHTRLDPPTEITIKRLEAGFTFVNFNLTVL